MTVFIPIILGAVLAWLALVLFISLAQNLPKFFSLPPLEETLGKLAVIAALSNFAAITLTLVLGGLGLIAGGILLWMLLYAWLDADVYDSGIIAVLTWFTRTVLLGVLAKLLLP